MIALVPAFTGFERVLFYIAVPFSIFTVIQLVLQFVGVGHDIDVSGHTAVTHFSHTDTPGFAVFTLSNLIYFLTMFGWSGIAASRAGASVGATIAIAASAGAFTSLLIGYIFHSLNRLAESGNLKLANAVGAVGSVYLPIPARRGGTGQVQLTVQGQTLEMTAVTEGDDLKTGTTVRVTQVLDGDIALVERTN